MSDATYYNPALHDRYVSFELEMVQHKLVEDSPGELRQVTYCGEEVGGRVAQKASFPLTQPGTAQVLPLCRDCPTKLQYPDVLGVV